MVAAESAVDEWPILRTNPLQASILIEADASERATALQSFVDSSLPRLASGFPQYTLQSSPVRGLAFDKEAP